ncbi:MAG: thermonuclease family protein [Candidatus Pacearchaeota archaeon]
MANLIKSLINGLIIILIIIIFFFAANYFKEKEAINARTVAEIDQEGQGSGGEQMTETFEKHVEGPKIVTKIIDGDTVIVEGNDVRLLGIDADERGYPCYKAAKQALEQLVLNKAVYLEYFNENTDKHGRFLRYLILDGENINLKLVAEGLVVARVSDDPYKEQFIQAEKQARESRLGCKWSNLSSMSNHSLDWNLSEGSIYACDARNYIGQEKVVEGKIVEIYKSKANTVFLNFEQPYPTSCFIAVIFSSSLNNFPNIEDYKDKIVKVSGLIKEYNGRPEIILESQAQIEIVH